MNQPLALILYERLLPGSQLANRLQDLKYRIHVISEADALMSCARQEKPLLALVDLVSTRHNVCAAITQLRQNPETGHIPVVAFAPDNNSELHEAARAAGATLVAGETAILSHLPQFLDQALQIE
jgi:CheY-like chemotaxis protein